MTSKAVRFQTTAIGLALIAVIMLVSGCENSEAIPVAPIVVEPTLTELPATVTVMPPTATLAPELTVAPIIVVPTLTDLPATATVVPPTATLAPEPTPAPNSPAAYSVSRADRVYPELAELYKINLSFKQFGMEILVTANIVGGPSDNRQMWCKDTTIIWGNELGLVGKADCLSYDDHPNFSRSHRFRYVFENPGEAEIVFIYDNLPPASIIVHIDEDLVWSPPTPRALVNNEIARELAELYTLELHVAQNGTTVEIFGRIEGGPDSHPDMHCPDREINWGDDIIVVEKAGCFPYEEGDKFPRGNGLLRAHQYAHQYTESGYYQISYRFGELRALPVVIYVDR